jgi:serine/threonine-protein kinase RIO1
VSQAVQLGHPNALEFLRRDVSNIQRFFSELLGGGLEDLYSEVVACLREEGPEAPGYT